MIKIYCLTAELNNGASIPRLNSIKHLEETGYPCVVQVATHISEFDIDWADIVVIHRPVDEIQLNVSNHVKAKGKKLWIDNDDDQLSLPIDHPAYLQYNRDDRRHYIRTCNKLADVVTISNENIIKTYGDLNKNIIYYPCAYDERLMPEPDCSPRDKVVLWRGSHTHNKSMAEFAPAVGRADKKVKGWKFVFIGAYPWEMLEQITENEWYCSPGYMPTHNLWDYSRKLKPAVQMLCLTENQFTRSRSNMAQLDGTIAGAALLAPSWNHWDTPGVTHYDGLKDFESKLTALMRFSEINGVRPLVESSWEHIQEKQTFKAINVRQWEIVKSLVGNIL